MKLLSLLVLGISSSPVGAGNDNHHRRWNERSDPPPAGGNSPSRRRALGRTSNFFRHPRRREGAFCPPSSTAFPHLADRRDDEDTIISATSSSSSSSSQPTARAAAVPRIFPARCPLPSFLPDVDVDVDDDGVRRTSSSSSSSSSFSILSWNILLPNSRDNWWCHKQYASNVDMSKRTWSHRRELIRERLMSARADVVCIQEADGETFDDDFDYMRNAGYDHVLHRKFRFRCATFYLREKFALENEAHKDRTLVTSLIRIGGGGRGGGARNDNIDDGMPAADPRRGEDVLYVVNCHLSGGAAPERRLRQVNDALAQIRKWTTARERDAVRQKSKGRKKRPSSSSSSGDDVVDDVVVDGVVVVGGVGGEENDAERSSSGHRNIGIVVCGDFNSDGNTASRKLLVEGRVDPDWREPQYPDLVLTSRVMEQPFGPFADAAELAYGGNVCDGDYAESRPLAVGSRPATYVVPNLASLLLLPISEEDGRPPRTEFGMQVAKGLAETLNLNDFRQSELDRAFALVDGDGNGRIDEGEVSTLLENVYVATYGQQIEQERNNFFRGFGRSNNQGNDEAERGGLTKEQFVNRLKALQNDCEGERKAFGLARGLNLTPGMSEAEMERAFDQIDLDHNCLLDEGEFQALLENVYVKIYGEDIERHRGEFFSGFRRTGATDSDAVPNVIDLTREQFTERLLALHQELNGGRTGSELAEVRTEADVDIMIKRFTPLLVCALDELFDKFSSNGFTLTQEEVNDFLIKTNGELGRGGTYRHTSSILMKKAESSISGNVPAELTRNDWYGVFARELAEGKWWQVVYDLEVCGFDVRSHRSNNTKGDNGHELYQGWLDYIYFQNMHCFGVQEGLTKAERLRIYNDGDALPNEWHPSDHIPVAAVFSWK